MSMKDKAKLLDIFFDAALDVKKYYEKDEQWYVEGYAATDDIDLINDRITDEAIKASEKDLLENSTVLRNHHLDEEIGKVVETKVDSKGLWVKVLISKTVPEVWQKVKEEVLNKFSIRMKILDAVKKWDDKLKRLVNNILRMKVVEVSLVSVPMNDQAKAIRWYVSKALQTFEQSGGQIKMPELTPEQKQDQAKVVIEKAFEELQQLDLSDEEIAQKFFELGKIPESSDDKTPEKEEDNDKKQLHVEGKDDEKKKRKPSLGTYITKLIKDVIKSELAKLTDSTKSVDSDKSPDSTKSVDDSKFTEIDERVKKFDTSFEGLTKDVNELKEKMIDLSKYPELAKQLEELIESFNGLTQRIKSIEENVTGSTNLTVDEREKGAWSGRIWPQKLQ